MNIEKTLREFRNDLEHFTQSEEPVTRVLLQEWLTNLSMLTIGIEGLRGAIQRATDVHDGMALMSRLLDSAHTEKLDADQVRCLIEPLRQRLELTIEAARQAL